MSLDQLHEPFYVQHINVSNEYNELTRLEVFKKYCSGRQVLHMGCTQYPLTDPRTSLHVQLAPCCARLDGYDIHTETYATLKPHIHNGRFLNTIEEAKDEHYDVTLIPEVLEHVGNPESFLGEMSKINSLRYIITVPDLFQCFSRHFEYNPSNKDFTEIVHPDHNYWFSPYTIANIVRKYTDWDIEGIYTLNKISLLVSCISRRTPNHQSK